MKTKSTLIATFFLLLNILSLKGNAQFVISNAALNHDSLYLNNINALFYNENIMGSNLRTGHIGYQVPKGSGRGTIFSSSLWIGGIDAGGHLHVAGQTYKNSGTDFWPGPLDTITATEDTADSRLWNHVWSLRKTEIDSFKLWTANNSIYPGYVVPQAILTWPGNGNQSKSQGRYIAPYVDVDGDGFYNPNNGDYPVIRGDQALFYACNDNVKGTPHGETGGLPLGIEMHVMPYVFKCGDADSALVNTDFVHYDIINRTVNTYDSIYIGVFTDSDIGCFNDDYVGCDSTLNSFFEYNGEPIDQNCPSGELPYGVTPPVQSTTFLNMKMTHFEYYNNDYSATGIPTIPLQYYNYMRSIWNDSTHVTYGGSGHLSSSQTINYMFPSNPSDTNSSSWNEVTAGDASGDRRGLGSVGPLTLLPGGTISLDIAYVFGRAHSGNNFASIPLLNQRIKDIQYDFLHDSTPCGEVFTTGVKEINPPNPQLSIYPNPANDKINIVYNAGTETVIYNILNVLGQSVSQGAFGNSSNKQLDVSALSSGIYFLKLTSKNSFVVGKFVKK